MATVYCARYILTPQGTLLKNGGFIVDGDTITGVGVRGTLKRSSRDRIVNLGNMLVMPGLINLHTHLEENLIRDFEKSADDTFGVWQTKRANRLKSRPPEEITGSIRLAVREALANGITTVVDTGRTGLALAALQQEPIRSWSILECAPESDEAEQALITRIPEQFAAQGHDTRCGAGPAALYSLSIDAHKTLARCTADHGRLWSMHLAESSEELQAFTDHSGDLFFQTTRRRSWPFARMQNGPVFEAISNNLIPRNGICVHATYIDGQEMSLLAAKGVNLVLCPQYSRQMGHKDFPLDVALRRGVNVCLGTETPVLSRPLSLFDEICQIKAASPHIPFFTMIQWATRNAARALGCAHLLGTLEPGRLADVIGVRFLHEPRSEVNDLEGLLIDEIEVAFVMVNGEEIITC